MNWPSYGTFFVTGGSGQSVRLPNRKPPFLPPWACAVEATLIAADAATIHHEIRVVTVAPPTFGKLRPRTSTPDCSRTADLAVSRSETTGTIRVIDPSNEEQMDCRVLGMLYIASHGEVLTM